jgi:hypothetical protein
MTHPNKGDLHIMPYSAADVRAREIFARMLIVGPPKSGKTHAAVLTSPGLSYVINSDGVGALDPVVLHGGEFEADDVRTYAQWLASISHLKANPTRYKTVIVDNWSSLSVHLLEEAMAASPNDTRAAYGMLKRKLVRSVNELFAMKMHVVAIGHAQPGDKAETGGGFGHMMGIEGSSKFFIPGQFQDWIWLEVGMNEAGEISREFLLAPQGNWLKGVRSIRDIARMPANVSQFLELVKKQRLPKAGTVAAVVKPAQPVQPAQQAKPIVKPAPAQARQS